MVTISIIDKCDNIHDLEAEYESWNMLTDEQKKLSDEYCKAKNGLTNREYYKQQKAIFSLNESLDLLLNDDELRGLQDKLNQSKAEMEKDPLVVIIPVMHIDPAELEFLYDKYKQSTQQYKVISNGLSLNIWGVSVDDAYEKVKGLLLMNDNSEEDNTYIENAFTNISNILENKAERVDNIRKPYDFTDDIPAMVPYLTYNEYCDLFKTNDLTVSDYINIDDAKKYFNTINILQTQLECVTGNKKSEIENDILRLGWFPYKKINGDSIKEARERQAHWFNENMQVNIIDLTEFNIDDIEDSDVLEETKGIKGDSKRLEPVYIVLVNTTTPIGKVIKQYTKSNFSHSGIATDSKLDKIYSYSMRTDTNQKGGGFTIESVKIYSDYAFKEILVLGVFVDKEAKKKIDEEIKFYEKNREKTSYYTSNFFNIVLHNEKQTKSFTMICSQFVDYILKKAGIDITNKSSNLVTPDALSKLNTNETNIYVMYHGSPAEYDYKKIDKQVKYLLKTVDYQLLSAATSDVMRNNIRNARIAESIMTICTDNTEVNEILREVRSYIAPKVSALFSSIDIERTCEENHRNIMTSSHSDIDNLIKLLYENRGLKLYINKHDVKDSEKLSSVLESDFMMHKNILSGLPLSGYNFNGFAKYYQDYINEYNMKYEGVEII